MKIKITRKMLLIAVAVLGSFLILYSLVKYLFGLEFSVAAEKRMMDFIIFSALGLFIYNRKLASDEKKAKEAAEEAERRKVEEQTAPAGGEASSTEKQKEIDHVDDDNDLPHWEQKEKAAPVEKQKEIDPIDDDNDLPHVEEKTAPRSFIQGLKPFLTALKDGVLTPSAQKDPTNNNNDLPHWEQKASPAEEQEEDTLDDSDLPHWERKNQ
jgi:hypothetical protein